MNSIAINRRGLQTLLKELIQIKSVNPDLSKRGDGEREIARFIGSYLEGLGLRVHYQELEKNRVNVIGVYKGRGGGQSIMLNGHTDTVGVDRMEIEPFVPECMDGRIYGRGSLDMKGGVAAQIMAVQSLLGSQVELKGDVILAFVADEEYKSIGTEALLNEYTADAGLICEPTDLRIVTAHKGFSWIKIELFGRAAHGSLPEMGVDAIMKAGKVLTEVENLGSRISIRKKHPLLGSPSIHASLIRGGIELSTYPDYCKIELERRTLPGEDQATVTQEIDEILKTIKARDNQFKATSDVFLTRPAYEVSHEEPIIQSLSRAYQSILDEAPQFRGMGGWLESALMAEAGIPTVIFGPSGEGAHASVEYVDFDSVIRTTEVLIQLMIDFCNV
jgi:acetylornithine deacetylase